MPDAPPVIGLGELLWDVFPDSRRPGGAPANVAFQATQLGGRGLVASRIGDDPLGRELTDVLQERGLDLSLVQTDAIHPTGQVTVDLSDGGHPDYVIHENVAWDFLEPADELLAAASQAAAVCFGTLAQRTAVSREAIHTALAACPPRMSDRLRRQSASGVVRSIVDRTVVAGRQRRQTESRRSRPAVADAGNRRSQSCRVWSEPCRGV